MCNTKIWSQLLRKLDFVVIKSEYLLRGGRTDNMNVNLLILDSYLHISFFLPVYACVHICVFQV